MQGELHREQNGKGKGMILKRSMFKNVTMTSDPLHSN